MDVVSKVGQHGWIEVITGSMFSGKSEELIRRLRRAQIARQKVQIFKPKFDSRYGEDEIVSHSAMRMSSGNVASSADLLDQVDTDARFHAAIIHLVVGEFAQAKALADTIAKAEPSHLFSHVIRGEAAEQEKDTATLARSYRAFLAGYDAEMKAGRREYLEHQPFLDQFRSRAQAAGK